MAGGLEKLPLPYGYKDGKADKAIAATQRLPNGQPLVGRNSYKSLMRFFTTFDITPEILREKAQKRLDELLPQVIIIASMHTSQVAHQNGTFPGFCSTKFSYSPLDGCQSIAGMPPALSSLVPIFTPGLRQELWE